MQNLKYKYIKREYEKFNYSVCNQRISIFQHQIKVDEFGNTLHIPHKLIYNVWGHVTMPNQYSAFNKNHKLDKYQIIIRYRADLASLIIDKSIIWRNNYIKIESCENVLLLNKWIAIYGIATSYK